MRRLALVGVTVIVVVLAAMFGIRAATSTVADDVGPGQVSVECSGWSNAGSGCADWGARILAEGAPSNTFEMEDVVRLRLDRPTFGLAATCEAEYFLSRYPDEVAWTEEVPCADG